MRSDFRQECPSTSSFEFIWSIVFTVLIPVGCPAFIAGVLIWSGIPELARKKHRQALLSAVFEVIDPHILVDSQSRHADVAASVTRNSSFTAAA